MWFAPPKKRRVSLEDCAVKASDPQIVRSVFDLVWEPNNWLNGLTEPELKEYINTIESGNRSAEKTITETVEAVSEMKNLQDKGGRSQSKNENIRSEYQRLNLRISEVEPPNIRG